MELPFVQAKTFVCSLMGNTISLSVVPYTNWTLKRKIGSAFWIKAEGSRYIGEYMSQICFNFPTCSIYTHNKKNIIIENALKFLLSQTKALHMA